MARLNVNINGNKKLVNSGKVRFIIWNLPSISTCPYATDLCKASCYARKAERVYPSVLPSREKNYEDSLKDSFVDDMTETISYYRNSKGFTGKKIVVRIHESGDFYSKQYADKWISIINHFSNDDSIVFMAYTKSLPFFEGVDIRSMKNFAFISSIWADTSDEMREMTSRNNYRVYTAVESFEGFTGHKCRCSDCAHCMACMNNNVRLTACEIH